MIISLKISLLIFKNISLKLKLSAYVSAIYTYITSNIPPKTYHFLVKLCGAVQNEKDEIKVNQSNGKAIRSPQCGHQSTNDMISEKSQEILMKILHFFFGLIHLI